MFLLGFVQPRNACTPSLNEKVASAARFPHAYLEAPNGLEPATQRLKPSNTKKASI